MGLRYPLLYLWLLLGWLPHAAAQNLASQPLPKRLSLLNDRAFLSFPAAAQNMARPADIMAADPNANRETRVVLDVGDSRLVFFAQEAYALGDKALVTEVLARENAKTGAKTTTLTDDGHLLSLLTTPANFDAQKPAILLSMLTVKTVDNTVFQVAAYLNPAGYPRRNEFSQLAERVFRTLAAGPRTVPLAAHSETVTIFGTTRKISFALPANYSLTTDQKYDFQVIKVRAYAPFGSTSPGQLLVYVGHHPSLIYKQYDLTRDQLRQVPGTFLEQPVSWLTHADEARHIYLQEQLIAGEALQPGLLLHVGSVASTPTGLAELAKIAAAVKLLPQ
ncbi:MAG: hypothetical protein ACRYFX_23205 [Janthinobacterium lividum]